MTGWHIICAAKAFDETPIIIYFHVYKTPVVTVYHLQIQTLMAALYTRPV